MRRMILEFSVLRTALSMILLFPLYSQANDLDAPVLNSITFSATTVDTTSASATIDFVLNVSDESPIKFGGSTFLVFEAPNGSTRFVNSFSGEGPFKGLLTISQGDLGGFYKLDRVFLKDALDNQRVYRRDELDSLGVPSGFTVSNAQSNVDIAISLLASNTSLSLGVLQTFEYKISKTDSVGFNDLKVSGTSENIRIESVNFRTISGAISSACNSLSAGSGTIFDCSLSSSSDVELLLTVVPYKVGEASIVIDVLGAGAESTFDNNTSTVTLSVEEACVNLSSGAQRLLAGEHIELPVHSACITTPDGTETKIPTTATAASINVTAVTPDAPGFVTVWPCGVSRPNASNLNYVAGDVVPNGVIAPIGSNGSVCLYSQSAVDLIVDVAGWFEGEAFAGATPQRLVDTRDGTGGQLGLLVPSNPLVVQATGISATTAAGSVTTIPSGAGTVALNLTVVNPSAPGFITAYPCDAARPLASNVNYVGGQVVANGVIAPVSASGQVCLYSSVATDIIVDLAGWFPGEQFTGATPKRFVDTRDGTGAPLGKLGPQGQLSVPVQGAILTVNGNDAQVPLFASAAALNVTVVNPEAAGFVTVWPCSAARPNASNLNFVAGQTVANNVVAPIGDQGNVCFYSSQNADLIVDVSGYFTGESGNQFVGASPKRFVDTRDGTGPAPK
jgi:hypothetical protein